MLLNREAQWILEEKYHGVETKEFYADLKRLEAGEPVDYIIGFVEFAGCRIGLSYRPLIPRPETEQWTLEVIKALKNLPLTPSLLRRGEKPWVSPPYQGGARGGGLDFRCLDLFSGSGCVGIALAKHVPNATVDFGDIDERCLLQIKENLETNAIPPERFRIFQSDVFSGIPVAETYALICANPPYINPADAYSRVAESVKNFEPHGAVFAGEEGFEYIRKVLAHTKNFLLPGGRLYLEHDDIQKERIAELLDEYGYGDFSFHKDHFGKWRRVMITKN